MDLTIQKGLTSYLFDKRYKSLLFVSALTLFLSTAIFMWLGLGQGLDMIVIGSVLGILYLYLCVRYPKFWLYSITLSTYFFFQTGKGDISAFEIIQGGFFSGSAIGWILWQTIINRQKIVKNIADWFLLFFFFIMLFTIFLAMFNGNLLQDWVREYLLFSVILLFFPFRHYLTSKKDLITLFILFAVSMVFTDILQLIMYKRTAIEDAIYAYQLGASIRFKQSIFSMTIVFGFLFSLYPRKIWQKLLITGFTGLTGLALMVSFSRTFWVMVMAAVALSWLYLPKKQKLGTLFTVAVLGGALIFALVFVFKQNTQIIFKVVENRLLSTSKGVKDVSVQMRLKEYIPVIKSIKELPLGGKGLGTVHVYRQGQELYTVRTLHIHNGYLFFAFRLGIPLFICFLFPMFYYMIKAEKLARRTNDLFLKIIFLGSFTSILIMLVANFMTTVFHSRDGTFLILFAFFLISNSEQLMFSEKK